MKVKEPLPDERKKLRPGQILFTYLHLAPDAEQTRDLIASGATCIAYETVTSPTGGLPLLTPMSEVAGRLAPQVGAHCLEKAARRPRRAARRRAGRAGGGSDHPRRRRLGHPCGDDRARHGRERDGGRPLGGRAARLATQFGTGVRDHLLDPRRHRANWSSAPTC